MFSNDNVSGERQATSEHLQASGALVLETSLLIDQLEKREAHFDTGEAFDFSALDEPFLVPEKVNEKIGDVTSATITYIREPELSISIELRGENASYWIDRYADTDDATVHDAVLAIPPLDSMTSSLMGDEGRRKLPHNYETEDAFQNRLENLPGLSNNEFTQLLMGLVYPGLLEKLSQDKRDSLASTDVFDPKIYEQLASASRTSTFSDRGVIDYTFKSVDGASLRYFYENGRTSSFQLTVPSEQIDGEKLVFQTDLTKGMTVETPAHATVTGMDQDLVDVRMNFPLSLRELTYLKETIQGEVQFVPHAHEPQVSDIDPDAVAVSTNLLEVVDGVATQQEDDLRKLNEVEIMNDIYTIYEAFEQDKDDGSTAES